MFLTPLGRVRAVGLTEGVSFVLLMFVAMPIKYLSAYPELGKDVVFWVGSIHGVLFMAYAIVALVAWRQGALSYWLVGLAALASLLPFGPFLLDRKLKRLNTLGTREPDRAEVPG